MRNVHLKNVTCEKSKLGVLIIGLDDDKHVYNVSVEDSSLRVSSRGYMLGYNDLKGPSVSGFFRFLARVGDGMMRMQILKIKFRGKQ